MQLEIWGAAGEVLEVSLELGDVALKAGPERHLARQSSGKNSGAAPSQP